MNGQWIQQTLHGKQHSPISVSFWKCHNLAADAQQTLSMQVPLSFTQIYLNVDFSQFPVEVLVISTLPFVGEN
jgi:hypothetical protein